MVLSRLGGVDVTALEDAGVIIHDVRDPFAQSKGRLMGTGDKNMRRTALWFCALVWVLPVTSPTAQAVILGQIDTFEDGTTMGWRAGGASPNPPVNTANGGPAGAGDAFLTLVATGGAGPGSRLSVLNESQWTGDFLAAGVGRISMDVNNFGPAELHLRLLFEDFDVPASPPVNLALSAAAVIVPANSGWVRVSFPIAPGDLVAAIGTGAAALADTGTLRIFHNPDPAFPGPGQGIPTVNVTLGVDNIVAQVPEPASVLWVMVGLTALLVLRRGARRRV